jgi:hypothetical protein
VCDRVLVYSTEGSTGAGRAIGRFDGIAAEAALAGWDVDVQERATDGDLDATVLGAYSQVWVVGTDQDFGTALDIAEVRAIRDFVDAGNGLLLAGGPTDGDVSYGDDLNLVAELYGLEFEDAGREGSDGALLPVEDADGTLLAGVSELPGFASVATLVVRDGAVREAATLAGAPAVAYRSDGQHIVFDRSWEGWSDRYRGLGDQAAYVANVARFLEPCAP